MVQRLRTGSRAQHVVSTIIFGVVTILAPGGDFGALQNFDAIQRMSQPVHADEGLLALASDLK